MATLVVGSADLSYLLTRLRNPGSFLLIMAVVLPFLSGSTVLLHIGLLAPPLEGCLELVRILVKFACILTVSLAPHVEPHHGCE